MATKLFSENGVLVRAARSNGVAPAIILAGGLVLASMIVVWGLIQVKQADQTIIVTGSAKKRIVSDKVIWRAGISFQANRLQDAYAALEMNVPRVRSYLISKGIKAGEIKLSAIEATTLTERGRDGQDTGRLAGYSLKQTIEVRSAQVAKVERLSRESTELINQGILLESMPPQYIYTKLADVKQAMMAQAAQDAKKRAEKIAASVGSHIGSVRSARMGVMQITPAYSNQVSNEGMNDTSSPEKDVTSVVSMTFALR